MKRLLLILILTFSFQTLTKADDIRDFQIEGMSIGDSALDFFSIDELNNSLDKMFYKNKEFKYYFLDYPKSKEYEYIQITVKPNDLDFEIYSVSGHIIYKENINNCKKKLELVNKEINSFFDTEPKKNKGKHWMDKSGQSTYTRILYEFNNGFAKLLCYDMSKEFEEKGKNDRFALTLISREFQEWIGKNKN